MWADRPKWISRHSAERLVGYQTVWPATPKLCSRHSAVGLAGLFVCTIILEIQLFAWRAQHLTPPHGAVERRKPMVPSTHCPVGRSPSLGPRRKISLICRGTQQSYLSLLAPSMEQSWKNCSSELFLINVVGNQQRSCSRRTAPITVASPTWSLHQDER